MNSFFFACAALVVLSALFYLLPPRRRVDVEEDLSRANLKWFQRRDDEIAGDEEQLREDARLRLLEDEAGTEAQAAVDRGRFPGWVLLPVVALGSALFYYMLGSYDDVIIAERLASLDDRTSPQQMESLIRTIEARSSKRPDNLHYSSLLGRYYMGQDQYEEAAASYMRMLEQVPEDPQVLAYAAQSQYLAAGRQLSDRARLLAEQSLAANPHQRTALGLLGMASFEQGLYREAIGYWERLLVMESPGSEGARMIAGVIADARAALGEEAPVAQAPAAAADVVDGVAGVTVRVTAPPGGGVAPTDTVYVLARPAGSDSRMPLAVQRFSGAELPLEVRLDDRSSMAGQQLSATPALDIEVQVSPDGRPGASTASFLGSAGPVTPGDANTVVEITLAAIGDSPAVAAAPAASTLAPGVTVRVSLPEGATPGPTDTVYVLARDAGSGARMPVAAQRLTASQLPLTLRLDDRHAMAGQKISAIDAVMVAVQVSPDGSPGEAGASFLGEAGPVAPGTDLTPVDIQLRPNTGG